MKRLLIGTILATFSLGACQTARTQNNPQVVTTPLSETPSATPVGDSTPAMEMTAPTATSTPIPANAATVPAAPKLSYSSCHVQGPYIAMTFDDGPSAKDTPRLLDMLKARNIKVTFFVLGEMVQQSPDLLKRMAAEGHEIANHSWNHPQLTKLNAEGLRKQLGNTSDEIEQVTGKRPTLMRPPYGATNAALTKTINEQYGMKVILWSVDPLDWKVRNADHVYSEIMKQTQQGGIILSHDIHPTTVDAMPRTLDALLAKGYKFVTVSELIAMNREVPPAPKKEATPAPAKKAKENLASGR
ncbi:hypothetical protein BH09VER1_BH09VER1_52900 [soil metagenome]